MTASTSDNRADRFGHQAATPKFRVRVVTDLTPPPLFMDPIDTDRSKRRTGAPLLDHPGAAATAAEQFWLSPNWARRRSSRAVLTTSSIRWPYPGASDALEWQHRPGLRAPKLHEHDLGEAARGVAMSRNCN